MLVIAFEGGPMKITLFLWHYSANPAFSERNPKPGCRASHSESFAISNILEELRDEFITGLSRFLLKIGIEVALFLIFIGVSVGFF